MDKQGFFKMTGFIELTITLDSYDDLAHPRKALIRVDQITSVVDVSSEKYSFSAVTKVSLMQENDYQIGTSDNGEIVRARRVIHIQENYDTVKAAIEAQIRTKSD